MQIIGITGGVGSGKSTVARLFAELGAGILDADKAGHEVLRLAPVEAAARQRWGNKVFGSDGKIDRQQLAQIVFAGPDARRERAYLEQLTHPEIARLLRQQAEELAAANVPVAVLDAALLFEAGWDEFCNKTVFVESPRDMRIFRVVTRGWNEADLAVREAAQESLDKKRSKADFIIDNSGSLQRTQAQVSEIWASLVR